MVRPREAATQVVLRTFRLEAQLVDAGERLAAAEGLTVARWQLLGALAVAARPLTVPQLARHLGLTRQSVQVTANRLLRERLLEAAPNPSHRRSPLLRLTKLGERKYEALQRRQVVWARELADGLATSELATAARVLQTLSNRLAGS